MNENKALEIESQNSLIKFLKEGYNNTETQWHCEFVITHNAW